MYVILFYNREFTLEDNVNYVTYFVILFSYNAIYKYNIYSTLVYYTAHSVLRPIHTYGRLSVIGCIADGI
jgi:hypothetical protein